MMAYHAALSVTLALFFIHQACTSQPCCPNSANNIVKKRCPDGLPITVLTCPHKYMIAKQEGVTAVDENQTLTISAARLPADEYCYATLNNTEVFLVCFSDEADLVDTRTVFTVYASLMLVSVFFILVTIFVYLQVSEVLDLQGVCILHSISGLALSFLALASNQLTTHRLERTFCVSLAYVIYFTMLYSFFWLNVLAFHIWRTIVKPGFFKMHKYWPHIYHGFGCGGPIMLLIILIIAHSLRMSEIHPGFGESKCWFQSTKSQFVYFYGPIAILLCLNIMYYGWTTAVLWRRLKHADEKKTKVLKYRLVLCFKLFFIMGISWIFELLSAAFQDAGPAVQAVWYVTDGLNTLQGILIFLVLVVFRKRVVRGLADRNLCGVRLPSRWRTEADDECEEIEEELNLSETQAQKH